MTPSSAASPSPSRRLLARLRDIMAGSGSIQVRLDKIVQVIASEMVAEVCSCYVMRPGEVLELSATVGLKAEAVHRTRLRVGEGLVGSIAAASRPLALADAQHHPSFAYRPETGEDPYQSLLGVPILRGGKVRGVLVIQNRQTRAYSEEEVETLQIIAMVVAELVANRDMMSAEDVQDETGSAHLPTRLEGVTLGPGLGRGSAVLHQPHLTIRELVADDPDEEKQRLRRAVESMHASLDALLDTVSGAPQESRDILETYRMFAEDRGWLSRIGDAIATGLTAEAAVRRVQNDTRARMAHITDPYLRERLLDFDDLANRLLLHLAGKTTAAAAGTLPDDMILVARTLGPAELLEYDRSKLRGVVLEAGAATSHVAIIAKAMDVPMVGRCADAMNAIEPLDPLVVDADNGQVFVRPGEDVFAAYEQSADLRAARLKRYAELADMPAETRDGLRISLHINAGLLLDLPHLHATGADGVGLYRTEIPFMVRSAYPDVVAQTDLYSRILEQAGDRPVVFRTLDVGGDKTLPYFDHDHAENPALGWRALRMGLDRPAMLRKQLRALIRASQGRTLNILFPLVAAVSELEAARGLLMREVARAEAEGQRLPDRLRTGVMLEVPALLWQLDELLPRVDFLAVGSNDLQQYLFAADRADPRLARRYDPLNPALLKVLRMVVHRATAAGVPVSLCGEMAGRPLEAMTLIGLGFRTLSMAPTAIGPIKAMIRSLDSRAVTEYLETLNSSTAPSLRESLRFFATDHNVTI